MPEIDEVSPIEKLSVFTTCQPKSGLRQLGSGRSWNRQMAWTREPESQVPRSQRKVRKVML